MAAVGRSAVSMMEKLKCMVSGLAKRLEVRLDCCLYVCICGEGLEFRLAVEL